MIDVVADLEVVAAPVDMKNQSQQEVYYLAEIIKKENNFKKSNIYHNQ